MPPPSGSGLRPNIDLPAPLRAQLLPSNPAGTRNGTRTREQLLRLGFYLMVFLFFFSASLWSVTLILNHRRISRPLSFRELFVITSVRW